MSDKNAFPAPQTIIQAGVRAHNRRQEEREADHRGEQGDAGELFSWTHGDWHAREELERQTGAQMGTSTYERGTVFAPPPRKEDE